MDEDTTFVKVGRGPGIWTLGHPDDIADAWIGGAGKILSSVINNNSAFIRDGGNPLLAVKDGEVANRIHPLRLMNLQDREWVLRRLRQEA